MSETDEFRKSALECMRLAADCTHLARSTDNLDLKAHFTSVARVWMKLAEGPMGPGFEIAESN